MPVLNSTTLIVKQKWVITFLLDPEYVSWGHIVRVFYVKRGIYPYPSTVRDCFLCQRRGGGALQLFNSKNSLKGTVSVFQGGFMRLGLIGHLHANMGLDTYGYTVPYTRPQT